ncbi:MAG: type I-E CRISPR-associated protein Cse1/CasA [Phycisphaerae bacterium]|nr:type I-E CRISPR-associated protein Cse1/CasA [Phycisphaerae bacterium]
MHFNLLDEKWIPILRTNGTFDRVGIRKALTEAGSIRQIAASNPMDNVALLRFLLAVLLWSKDDAKSALATQGDGSVGIAEDWLAKLDDHKTAFDLLGDESRFYQDASLKGIEARAIADLLVEFPGAQSVNHMRHVVHDGSYGFCPACCTMGILRLSVWAPANRYYPASVNPGTAAYAITQRKNLLLTLVANAPEAIARSEQAPWLSNAAPDSPGAVANLAWRPRKLWLNVASGEGFCTNCGSSGVLIASVCNEGGWPTPTTGGQQFAKAVEAELKKHGYNPKAKDQESRNAKRLVKNAPLIRACRMEELREASAVGNPLLAVGQSRETDEQRIARMFYELISTNKEEAIRAVTRKATADEQKQLGDGDTKTKKFWDADPHLLTDGEAISLPGLSADVAAHASRFWRNALHLRGTRSGKVVAIGPVVNKFVFQDATSVSLPNPAAGMRAELTNDCSNKLRGLVEQVTPNPDCQHPEISAAIVLATPDTESRILATLNESDATPDDTEFLHEVYQPLVEQVVASTTRGSSLRRREAIGHVRQQLHAEITKLSQRRKQGGT